MGYASAAIVQNTVLAGFSEGGHDEQWVRTEMGAFFFHHLTTTTFQATDTFFAQATTYFLVEENDPITWWNIDPSSVLITNTSPFPHLQTFSVPDGGSILLGFWEDADESVWTSNFTLFHTSGDNYGWVRVQNQGGILSAVNSAVAEDGPGILAGTLTPVPEPSIATLGLSGLLVALRRKR